MVGDLAAALDPMDGDAAGREGLGRGQDVGRVRVSTEGQDGRVLEEQELIRDRPVGALGDQALLEGVGRLVVHPTEPARLEAADGRGRVGPG